MYVQNACTPYVLRYLSLYCTYAQTYIIIKIYIIIYILSIQILMSVVMIQMVALIYVQTLQAASFVDVIVALYWMRMGLLVTVSIHTCTYMTGSVKTSLTFQPFVRVALPDNKFSLVWDFVYKIINIASVQMQTSHQNYHNLSDEF